ncbi:MAG: FtsB family cell division protein [Verrucomicrobiales bacterium]
MKVNLGIWHRLSQLMYVLLAAAAFLIVGIWYLPLIKQNERMRQQILELDNQIKVEENQVKNLEIAINALRTDPKAVERLAREKLGYAKPGETVIYFEDRSARHLPHTIR